MLLLSGCSVKHLRMASTGLLVADWKQTQYIAAHSDTYHEKNPVLGRHPSRDIVNLYFAGVVLLHWNMKHVLTEHQSLWYYTGVVLLETLVVSRNLQLGIRF